MILLIEQGAVESFTLSEITEPLGEIVDVVCSGLQVSILTCEALLVFSVAKGSNFTEELVLVSSTPIENGIKVCGGEVVTFTAVGHLSLDFFVTDCLKLETEWLLLDRDSMQARLYPSGLEFALETPYILRLVAKGNTIVCCT